MANNCMVGIQIVTTTETDGEKLHGILTSAKMIADKKREGVYIGCERRYLFDAQIFRDRDTVQVFGWVKWGFSDDEVKSFIAWLKTQVEIKELRINYDECGCLLYGEYRYADEKLTQRYLPAEHFPDDDDSDHFGIELESALKRYGITEEIPLA